MCAVIKCGVLVLIFYTVQGIVNQCEPYSFKDCVPVSNCSNVKQYIQNGNLVFCDVKQEPYVCCTSSEEKLEIDVRKTKAKSLIEEKCEEYSLYMKKFNLNLVNKTFTAGVTNASLGQFPHVAALGYGDILGKIYWGCEGSLISNKFILTVAQCLQLKIYGTVKYVKLGDIDIGTEWIGQIYLVTEIHEMDNIALIKVNEDVIFTEYRMPACLFSETNIDFQQKFHATGWNFTVNNIRQETLQNLQLLLVKNNECNEIYEQNSTKFNTSEICVKSDNNTCGGNLGGSLQTYDSTKRLHYLTGLSTSGLHCTVSGTLGVYLQIDKYVKWIENTAWVDDRYEPNISQQKCENYTQEVRKMMPQKDRKEVFGGEDAAEDEFPHMVALGYGNITDIQWLCGGSLISHNFVLTAAHCISSHYGNVTYIQLGMLNITNGPAEGGILRLVKEIFVHENYTPPVVYNDIALLKLDKPTEFSINIKPACLYRDINFIYISRLLPLTLKVTGWGSTNYGGEKSVTLQKADVKIFDNCNYTIRRRLKQGILKESQICAGDYNIGNDTCPGDSGGPLQWYDPFKKLYALIGITSFGFGCGTAGVPGVYTRVAYFVPWIENIVWQ